MEVSYIHLVLLTVWILIVSNAYLSGKWPQMVFSYAAMIHQQMNIFNFLSN